MVTRTIVRTPRKAKIWADRYPGEAQVLSTTQSSDLLGDMRTALGISESAALTCMRIIGRFETTEDGTASTPAHGRVQLGIAWATTAISADSSVDIFGNGVRELEWIWRDTILYAESSSVVTGRGCATVPPERNNVQLDTTMMRKQPSPQHRLRLYWVADSAIESTTVNLRFHIQALMALP